MTMFAKAKQIAENGMQKKSVFNFFSKVNRDVVDYVVLFGQFGVSQNVVWDMYEDWQEED